MKLLIVYASREGQTAKIANHVKSCLLDRVEAVDVAEVSTFPLIDVAVASYDAVLVAVPVYAQHHLDGVAAFVKTHRETLAMLPSMFVSVSLAAADTKPDARKALQHLVDLFYEETGWQPEVTEFVPGALVYSHYGFFKRWLLYWIMRKAGVRTKTSQDYEYTNWDDVAAVADRFWKLGASSHRSLV